MKPITFDLKKTLDQTPEEIRGKIADLSNWSDFKGYGPLPGIEKAVYETRTEEMTGSQIRVTNSDGSEHCEEICEWGERVIIRLSGFSPPLKYLATHFHEEWEFDETDENETLVMRRFRLFPKNLLTRPVLLLISMFFKKAVARHLDGMADER